MKKIFAFAALYFLTSASVFATSSVIPLVGGGNVAAGTVLKVPLTGLISSVTYSVVCYIDTTFPFQFIHLGSSFADVTSAVTAYTLNGNYVTQAQLIPGHNIAVITGHFTTPSTSFVEFTNLDQTNPFNVNNCFGIPVQTVTNTL